MELPWETAGWAGAAAILSAYMAVSMGWAKAGGGFQSANLLGACAFIVNGTFHEAWPSVVTNLAWFLISAIALLRIRSVSHDPPAAIENCQAQFPGVPDTTGQLGEVSTPACSSESRGQPGLSLTTAPRMQAVGG